MSNYYDEVRHIVQEHRNLQRAVQSNADSLADLLADNLRNVSSYHLKRIKKLLSAFDAHTGQWKR